jgi:hypothetical protein
MAVVVVGGGGRGVGKTALTCGIIAALPEMQWVAVKITRHEHIGEQLVWEETEPGERTDTARYLAAGARRAMLLTAIDDAVMRSALDQLWKQVERGVNLIFESNRVLDFVKPDVFLIVRSSANSREFKTSFENAADLADAVVVAGTANAYREGPPSEFELARLEQISSDMETWIRGRLIYG